MIDIIVPAYNAHDTIIKTLISISMQEIIEKINVYIINDCSDKDYSEEIDIFKDKINIKELKLEKNMGPGYARQYGIDNSDGKYILFLDSDDVLYDVFSVKNLYLKAENDNVDLICGMIYEELVNGFFHSNNHQGCLHGKLYNREFLKKYNIRFNNSRNSEDNSFNQLVILSKPKISFIEDDVYVYKYNANSITRNSDDYYYIGIRWYVYNMHWVVSEAERRNYNIEDVAIFIVEVMGFMYYRYCNEPKFKQVIKYLKEIYNDFIKYEKKVNEKIKYNILFYRFEEELPSIKFSEFLNELSNI